MTAETVLIAAFSGRALAQSARRAGYVPLVADAFGDLDTRAAAHDVRVVAGAMEHGFRTKTLVAALDQLVTTAPSKPIGIVLGSGLEDKPRLWDLLDKRFGVLGCRAETMRTCKDPAIFFAVLDQLGIAHPQTRTAPPDNPDGWITKRTGGSGGRHIRIATAESRSKPRRYFQKLTDGARISVSAVIAGDGITTAFSQQWASPSPVQRFRYGGAVSLPDGSVPCQATMLSAVDALARAFDLKGLVSFDFIISSDAPYLLEINPRAGATLDIFDDAEGTLFSAHVAASQGNALDRRGGDLEVCKAAAIVHADRGPITLGKCDWPEWAADRGAAGTQIPQGAPIATVFAEAATPDAATTAALARLAALEDLIYGSSKS